MRERARQRRKMFGAVDRQIPSNRDRKKKHRDSHEHSPIEINRKLRLLFGCRAVALRFIETAALRGVLSCSDLDRFHERDWNRPDSTRSVHHRVTICSEFHGWFSLRKL